MLAKPRRRRQAPDLETNTAPDILRDDAVRNDGRQTPPDSIPPRDDVPPSDYEREIDRIDAATRGER